MLGRPGADIDVIRTGGPAVTEDVVAELVVSTSGSFHEARSSAVPL
jgi:hypothetical protein